MAPRAPRLAPLVPWSAGGAFVASFAYFIWSYLVRFDDLGAPRGASALLVNLALFTAFALHHSLLARPWAKVRVLALLPGWLERPAFVWVASLLFFMVIGLWQPVAGVLYWHHGPAGLVHRAIQLLGVAIVGSAAWAIGPLHLAGIHVSRQPADTLRVRGPYKWVRHPIYLGWLLFVFGAPHMNGTRLSFAVISTTYLLIAMPWEERSLAQAIGRPYAHYLGRVRARLVPRLY